MHTRPHGHLAGAARAVVADLRHPQSVTRETFASQADKPKLKAAEERESHCLPRSTMGRLPLFFGTTETRRERQRLAAWLTRLRVI